MLRRVIPILAIVSSISATAPAVSAQPFLAQPIFAQPDAGEVRKAAQAFDDGARAFKAGDYEEAASRFEAADNSVPSADSLRLAIRARSKAGQSARAASLAALAVQRYPTEEKTRKVADDTIEAAAPELHKVNISCASPCVLAVGTRGIHGEATTRWEIFLEPGNHEVSASFFGDAGGGRVFVQAEAGGETSVRIEPDEEEPPPVAPPPKKQPEPQPTQPDDGADTTDDGWGLHPAFFIAGIVATAGVGGVTIWSGIDTQNNPGADAVREGCRGQGEDCELYQDGLDRQNRTNILIGVTAGVGALTVLVGTVLTDWGGGGDDAAVSFGPAVGPTGGGLSANGSF